MRKFTIYWKDGKREVLEGNDIADAFNKAGYGAGALRALDFYATGDNTEYQWNKTDYKWEWTEEMKAKMGIQKNLLTQMMQDDEKDGIYDSPN